MPTQTNQAGLPQDVDLVALGEITRIEIKRLQAFWNGKRPPTYFEAFQIYYATNHRLGPNDFRHLSRKAPKRARGNSALHGERVWGNEVGHILIQVITDSRLDASAWFKKHGIPAQSVYGILLDRRMPRAQLISKLERATSNRLNSTHLYRLAMGRQAASTQKAA